MAERIPEEVQKEIGQLQGFQRQLQMVSTQRQRFELDVVQMDTALAELEKAKGKAYKSIGTLLIEDKPKNITKELNEKRLDINARIETLKKQEDRLKSKTEELQKKIESSLEKK